MKERKVLIGETLEGQARDELITLLRINHDCFAWSYKDMKEISSAVITHQLNVNEGEKSVKKKRRRFAPEQNKIINEEIEKLLANGFVREVQYLEWLANVVVVKKKNRKWRVCVDFPDLNKACPKYLFPLLHIDLTIETIVAYIMLSFMDAYSGYNQILVHLSDQEKNVSIT